jgi:signal transduction histidine kinase
MKIRQKLALIFTGLCAFILLGLSIFIYVFSRLYTEDEFYANLKERANITAEVFLKKDELGAQLYNDLRREFMNMLPNEKEYLLLADTETRQILSDSSGIELKGHLLDEIFDNEYTEFRREERQWVGILYDDNQGDFIVLVSAIDKFGENKLRNLRKILIIGFVCSVVMIYLLGLFYARQALRPISDMIKKVNEIGASNLQVRVDEKGQDEISELAATFNKMLDRLEVSFEIQNNFISNASHELKNPLTAILGETEIALSKERSAEDYRASLEIISNEASRLEKLTINLLKLAQTSFDAKGLRIESIDLTALLDEIKEDFDEAHPENDVHLLGREEQEGNRIYLNGSRSLIKIAVTNLIENACKFSGNKEVDVELKEGTDTIEVNVKDRGVGIPREELKNIFEPFYRASNVRGFKGFGIGLPLTHKIVRLHHGYIEVRSEENKGTHFTLNFNKSGGEIFK